MIAHNEWAPPASLLLDVPAYTSTISPVHTAMLRIKMYPAKNGDAFFIDADDTYLLIDAG